MGEITVTSKVKRGSRGATREGVRIKEAKSKADDMTV